MRHGADRTWSARVALLIGLLLAATLVGAWRVSVSGSSPGRDHPVTLRLGEVTLSVTHVERVVGLGAEDLGGMTHGIQGLVAQDQSMLRVSLMLTAGGHLSVYDPDDLWIERSGSGRGISPVGGDLGRGSLSPGASIGGAVSFVVPRDGATYVLHATGTEGAIDLGMVDAAPLAPPAPEHEGHEDPSRREH